MPGNFSITCSHLFRLGQLALGLLALFASTAVSAALTDPVHIEPGLVQGIAGTQPSVTVFRGIPYAAPPVGELRWKAPMAVEPWQGVKVADQFGDRCPQRVPGGTEVPMSEDCLTLNIWTAAESGDERRPVYVWIYGGGFSGGTGSDELFDGETLARKGLVVVTFNYRLGSLGFLATPELSAESGHNASGNYGLLDDIAVLHWVQNNIAAFGGDPANVTLGGQSAGGGSVGFLSMSPLAKGLFQRAVVESHSRHPQDLELRYLSVSHRSLESAESNGTRYVESLGAESLEELRALPWQALLIDNSFSDTEVYTGSSSKPPLFRPVIDGWVIPHNYNETYSRGAQNEVFYLTGNNLDETGAVPETSFTARAATAARSGVPSTVSSLAGYLAAAHQKYGDMADEFLQLYPATTDDEAAYAANDAARDNSRVSTYLWGTLWAKHATKPFYTYYWTHRPPGPSHDMRGAYHGSEIGYFFGNPDGQPWTEEDRRISDVLTSYLVNYVTIGNPNGMGLPEWPAYNPDSPTVMELGDRFELIAVTSPARLDFWKRFFTRQEAW